MEVPEFIVHYSRGEPFRSISSVGREGVTAVLKELDESNAWGLGRFSDADYLERRLVVEQKVRRMFIEKGGNPVLEHPVYFFLGRSAQFEAHELNVGYMIRLSDIPVHTVSFTYGDSMFSFNEDYRIQKGGGYMSELCPRIYTPAELPLIYSHADYASATRLHIEAQLWINPSEFAHPLPR